MKKLTSMLLALALVLSLAACGGAASSSVASSAASSEAVPEAASEAASSEEAKELSTTDALRIAGLKASDQELNHPRHRHEPIESRTTQQISSDHEEPGA